MLKLITILAAALFSISPMASIKAAETSTSSDGCCSCCPCPGCADGGCCK